MRYRMNKVLVTLICVLSTSGVFAQQDIQYTQFMHNKLALNPAVAGSKGVPVLNALARQQWFGIEGAPASQAIGFHGPLSRKRVGLGLVLTNDEIGFTRSTMLSGNYAYHIQVGEQTFLSAGISASARQYQLNWDEAQATQVGDPNVPLTGQSSQVMANFGTGLFLYNDKFYAGLSAPRLLRNRLGFHNEDLGAEALDREEVHMYGMAGMMLPLGDQLALKPALLVKYVNNAPIDMDLHASLVWNQLISLGATYRTGGSLTRAVGESIDVLVGLQVSKQVRLGLSYDYTLTKINSFTPGSGEIFLEYTFLSNNKRLTNPRFF